MNSMKSYLENVTKTRINLIGPSNKEKAAFMCNLTKKGVFSSKCRGEDINFSTEILFSAKKTDEVKVFIDFRDKTDIIKKAQKSLMRVSKNVFKNEISLCENQEFEEAVYLKYIQMFSEKEFRPLTRFMGSSGIREALKNTDFNSLKNVIRDDSLAVYEEDICRKYFKKFTEIMDSRYDEWVTVIAEYYIHYKNGYSYENKLNRNKERFFYNENLEHLENILYNPIESCGYMINRIYFEAQPKYNDYKDSVFINYNDENCNKNIAHDIENIVSRDYKEMFIVMVRENVSDDILIKIRETLNDKTINNRVFAITTKNRINKVSECLKLNKERIFEADENLEFNQTEFAEFFEGIKKQSKTFAKPIKVRSSSKENVISITLNENRMSVQSLMEMLFAKYNDYIIEKYVKNNEDLKNDIKLRCSNKNILNWNKAIGVNAVEGELSEGQKIVRMLVNYGYQTVGFNSRENKILVTVNGEISKEDEENLIGSIKGRLEESSVKYFEDAFMHQVKKKNIRLSSEPQHEHQEMNLTIDDFYSAFRKAFRKMSKDIERYEISVVD